MDDSLESNLMNTTTTTYLFFVPSFIVVTHSLYYDGLTDECETSKTLAVGRHSQETRDEAMPLSEPTAVFAACNSSC